MARHKNAIWELTESPGYPGAQLGVLMDIRDELQKLNALLHCQNFRAIPQKLDEIKRNTSKRKRAKGKS